ncbi:MAG TPA: hypothetical protein VFY39_03915, partial [Gammaproteobacteria bacterium]|nr:hypothetical protein [Gammaproteobacteria bacterium]
DLVHDPEGTVAGIYAHFGWEMDSEFAGILHTEAAKASRFRSRHRYALEALGLSAERIVAEFRDIFERFDFPMLDNAEPAGAAKRSGRRMRSPAGAPKRSILG